jgi:hypothetical protein
MPRVHRIAQFVNVGWKGNDRRKRTGVWNRARASGRTSPFLLFSSPVTFTA